MPKKEPWWPDEDDIVYISAAAKHGLIQDEVDRVCNAAHWALRIVGKETPEAIEKS